MARCLTLTIQGQSLTLTIQGQCLTLRILREFPSLRAPFQPLPGLVPLNFHFKKTRRCSSFTLMIQPGEFHYDPSHRSAPTMSHVTLSMRKKNEWDFYFQNQVCRNRSSKASHQLRKFPKVIQSGLKGVIHSGVSSCLINLVYRLPHSSMLTPTQRLALLCCSVIVGAKCTLAPSLAGHEVILQKKKKKPSSICMVAACLNI